MTKKDAEPLRGESAWKAAKKGIAERNEEAYARGRRERAARNAAITARRHEQELQEQHERPRRSGASQSESPTSR